MTIASNNQEREIPICCYCDHVLSCAQCGKEQPPIEVPAPDTRATPPQAASVGQGEPLDTVAQILAHKLPSLRGQTWEAKDSEPGKFAYAIAEEILAALASPVPRGCGEPVAWAAWHPEWGWNDGTLAFSQQTATARLMRTGVAGNHDWTIRPLYATPQPAPDGVREALEKAKLTSPDGTYTQGPTDEVIAVVRAALVERNDAGPREPVGSDEAWRQDPSSDERWNAGCDFAMLQLCAYLDVDPDSVNWDAATETVDGDVQAVIGNIMRSRLGEDFDPTVSQSPAATPPEPQP